MKCSKHVHGNPDRKCQNKKLLESHKKVAPNIPSNACKQRIVLGKMQVVPDNAEKNAEPLKNFRLLLENISKHTQKFLRDTKNIPTTIH